MLLPKLKRYKYVMKSKLFFPLPNIYFASLYFSRNSTSSVSKGEKSHFYIDYFFILGEKETSDFFTVGDVVKKTITSSLSKPCCHILYLRVTGNHKHWRSKEKTTKGRCYMSGKNGRKTRTHAKKEKYTGESSEIWRACPILDEKFHLRFLE